MIEKITLIKNIGKFENHNAKGNSSFKKLTAIFSGNAMGKSTIADILRSLSLNSSDIINGRQTLGGQSGSEVHLRLGGQNFNFKNGAWDQKYENIAIYDSTFVSENIYGGNVVDHAHKRNLFRIIIGKKGVALANTIDDLDERIRNIQSSIKSVKEFLLGAFGRDINLDEIIDADVPQNIDQLVEEKKRQIAAAEQQNEIKNGQLPSEIQMIDLPSDLAALLSKTIEDVSNASERVIEEHLARHGTLTEKWIAFGTEKQQEPLCPFCGQNTNGIELIAAYKAVFGEKYKALKAEISNMENVILSSDVRSLISTKAKNDEIIAFWSKFIDIDSPTIDIESVALSFDTYIKEALILVRKKESSPLDVVAVSEEYISAEAAVLSVVEQVNAYNLNIDRINLRIEEKKKSISVSDISVLKRELVWLLGLQKKRDKDVQDKCAEYLSLLEQKGILEKEKAEKREELEKFTESIFPAYQKKINDYLLNFGADFSIVKTQGSFVGGKPSSNYQLMIKNVIFDIGDSRTPVNVPSFKNTLSTGDKSTLSLAFFLASLDLEPDAAERIVVFDDPFASQDRFRRKYTQQLIVRECSRSKQVILLSHDENFLQLVWKDSVRLDRNSLKIIRSGSGSSVVECNLEAECSTVANKDQELLVSFIRDGSGNAIEVARAIRPWIESWMRQNYIGCFSTRESLGDMIQKIRTSDESSVLHEVKPLLDEMSDLNDFSTGYQHGENSGGPNQTIDDGELKGYVNRAQRLTGLI